MQIAAAILLLPVGFEVQKIRIALSRSTPKGLVVRVLGTVFNLQARQDEATAKLSLESGHVKFISTKTNKNVLLINGQKAILNRRTGEITVIEEHNPQNSSTRKRGYLTFSDTTLSEVVKAIEEYYQVHVQIADTLYQKDLFTGSLPLNNLNETMTILKQSYHLGISVKEKD